MMFRTLWRRAVLMVGLAAAVLSAAPAIGSAPPTAAGTETPTDLVIPISTGRLLHIAQPIRSIVVGDPRIADVKLAAPQLVYVFGTAIGTTDITVLTEDDKVLASLRVVVAPDAPGAGAALNQNHPDSGLDYEIVGNRLVLSGKGAAMSAGIAAQRILDSAADSAHRGNEADYDGPEEITLKVRFAEVDRTQMYNLGLDWSALFGIGSASIGLMTGGAVGQAVGAPPVLGLSPFATPSAGISTNRINANLVLEALEGKGVVHTIAEPTLTVRSGRTAKFRAGGDIPVPVPQPQGALSIEYHPFGISLEFTPVLLGNNRIAIHVVPEVSQVAQENAVSFSGASVPSFTVRRAETDVELASGQTFAIAGLFQRNLSNTNDSIPGVDNMPILSDLFHSQQFMRGETELVILITPYLVAPASEPVATPADRAAGHASGKSGQGGGPSLLEQAGFIVE
jgi:pilus assembly protein CpaC